MKETSVDKEKVLALSRRYGELDGEISYFYATAFAQVAKTLTPEQKATLLKLRNLDAKFTCKGAYVYSRAIETPEVPNTDFLIRRHRRRQISLCHRVQCARYPQIGPGAAKSGGGGRRPASHGIHW